MNRYIFPLMLNIVLGSATMAFAAETTVTLAVENMTCALCPVTVRKAIARVDGVIDTEIDMHDKTATVTFDDARTAPEDIAKASTNAGYPATQI